MWARTATLGALLIVWVILRVAFRRRIAHPWFAAFVLMTAGAAAGDAAVLFAGNAGYAVHAFADACALGAVAVFAEGLRRESGAPATPRAAAVLAVASIAIAAAGIARLPGEQGPKVAGVLCAALLLNAIAPLLRAPRRRIGSLTIAAGIVVYALGRTSVFVAHAFGADEHAARIIADIASIAVFGAALLIYAVEDARETNAAALERRTTVA